MNKFFKIISGLYLLTLLTLALYPPLITSYEADATNSEAILKAPHAKHLLGTDELGRDLLARLLQGAKYSLGITLTAALISALIGLIIGGLGAYAGGVVDLLLLRLTDLFYGIPDLLVYIILGLFLGRNPFNITCALSLFGWVSLARLVRFEVLREKNKDYVTAAKSLGDSGLMLLIRHIFPNIWPLFKTAVLLKIPHFILAEASLSFLGLGLGPPLASFGILAFEGYQALRFYPYLALGPIITIAATMLALQSLAGKRE